MRNSTIVENVQSVELSSFKLIDRNYEKTIFVEGSKAFISTCASSIQSIVRGFLNRLKFFTWMKDNKYTPTNKELQTKLISHNLSRIAGKMSGYVQKQSRAIQAAVSQSEAMMKQHESLMQDYSKNYERIMRERNDAARERLEQRVEAAIMEDTGRIQTGDASKWGPAYHLASKRLSESCSICLSDLQNGKPLILTSCGHLFHATCVISFESFSVKPTITCPNCRHPYDRVPFVKQLIANTNSIAV